MRVSNITIPGSSVVELGSGVSKEINTGKIGYQLFSTGFGAGMSNGTRTVKIFDHLDVSQSISSGSLRVSGDATITNASLVNSSISNLFVTNITVPSLNTTSITTSNFTTINVTASNLIATNLTASSLLSTNFTAGRTLITSIEVRGQNLYISNITGGVFGVTAGRLIFTDLTGYATGPTFNTRGLSSKIVLAPTITSATTDIALGTDFNSFLFQEKGAISNIIQE